MRTEDKSSQLAFHRVSKVFPGGVEAFVDVTFDLLRGEFVGIVGPSGCGKTTILKVASGLMEPSGGRVRRSEQSIGYVFQDPTLLPWRTALGNAELFLQLQGTGKRERRQIAREALELVDLSSFEGHLPRQLSGGMRMRVSLARSLATEPGVFLFDEPFGAVDEITRGHLNEQLSQLFVRKRFGALFITHSIVEAVFLCTRVFVMSPRPGRFIAEFEVPFEHPRLEDLKFNNDFTTLTNEVFQALRKVR